MVRWLAVVPVTSRPMTEPELVRVPDWRSWAVDQLEDDELSHCGHLDYGVIEADCRHCEELVRHLRAHSAMTEGWPDCALCHSSFCANCGESSGHRGWCRR